MAGAIVQKWNGFVADWREYQRLRHMVSDAHNNVRAAQTKITEFYRYDERVKPSSCISVMFVNASFTGCLNNGGHRPSVPKVYDYCPHFSQGVKCTRARCPFCECNHKYIAAAVEYENAVARCDKFDLWRSVKSNTK